MSKSVKILLFVIQCLCGPMPNMQASPIGVKLGFTAAAFSYTDRQMEPYKDLEIDLRPYLGYDIKWVQLGEQKPLIAPAFQLLF